MMNRNAAAGRGSNGQQWVHADVTRRQSLQIGAIGILGLGMNHLAGLRDARAADGRPPAGTAKSCIFIFLSGGLAQHESFDMKPDAPADVRGELDRKSVV